MSEYPILCVWDGETLTPVGSLWGKRADEQWIVGEKYYVEIRQERSEATHRHEFAWLREAWQNLPETLADLYPTAEHLRKRALIDAGYYDEKIIDCSTNAAALRVASFARKDDFALVIVRAALVVVRTAKSQSRRAMNRQEFAASKAAIIESIAAMIGTTPEALTRAA